MSYNSSDRTTSRRDKGSTVLLWDCTPERQWATEFEKVVSDELKLDLDVYRVRTCAQCCECGLTRNSKLLVLTAHSSEKGQTSIHLKELRDCGVRLPICVITDAQDRTALMQWIEDGASDFIAIPVCNWRVLARLKHWIKPSETRAVADELAIRTNLAGIVGRSEVLRTQLEKARRYAGCDSTVLILGETGTGKEVFARAIHYASPRASHPFVPINCAALPTDLIENELFGHESGAYTGAHRLHIGLIGQAENGTLFLDEVNSLPLSAQAKLLRFLQEREYRPLGAKNSRRANVRVISASNSDLQAAARGGHFREDLFFRLNVLPLTLPPLRQRHEDVPLLAEHLLARHALKTPHKTFSGGALNKLVNYSWPGNVRELENVIERALALSAGDTIEEADVDLPGAIPTSESESFKIQKARAIYEFEHRFLQDALVQHGGNITRAAKSVAKNRRVFYNLLRKHNLTNRSHQSCLVTSIPQNAIGI